MKLTKTQLIKKLYELNKKQIDDEMRLGNIKPNSNEAVEAINRHGQRSRVIAWVDDIL